MGLVATMSALVLSLVISSAKSSFDALSSEMTKAASEIILLDRMESKKSANPLQLRASTREVDSVYEKFQGLLPKDDRQRPIQARALGILTSLE
jgi:hypothetical protein